MQAPDATAVFADRSLRAVIEALPVSLDRETLIDRLLAVARQTTAADVYVFEMMVGWPEIVHLRLDEHDVCSHPAGDHTLLDWEGTSLTNNVDGPLFTISDEQGIAAWAGIKRVSSHAQDVQVATRPDCRNRGFGRAVVSHAIEQLIKEGVSPYYAYMSGNDASLALATSPGFVPYGSAVIAETEPAR